MRILLIFLVVVGLFGCSQPDNRTVILVSKKYKDHRFDNWLKQNGEDIRVFDMYHQSADSIEILMGMASGMIISGGNDVNPAMYNQADEIDRCGKLNLRRDSIESKMIQFAMDQKIPLLGICRGHQLFNVMQGGSLIIDIPSDYDTIVVHRAPGVYVDHRVVIDKASRLYEMTQVLSGIVKSKHHQAVAKLGNDLVETAASMDGLIEGVEISDTLVHPFAMGVQWHPEKMDYAAPLSAGIHRSFMSSAAKFAKGKR